MQVSSGERLGSPRAYEQLKRRQLRFNVSGNAEDFVRNAKGAPFSHRFPGYNLPVSEGAYQKGRKTRAYPKVAIKGSIIVLVVVLWKHCRKSRHGKLSNRNRRGPRKKTWVGDEGCGCARAVDNRSISCFAGSLRTWHLDAHLTLL